MIWAKFNFSNQFEKFEQSLDKLFIKIIKAKFYISKRWHNLAFGKILFNISVSLSLSIRLCYNFAGFILLENDPRLLLFEYVFLLRLNGPVINCSISLRKENMKEIYFSWTSGGLKRMDTSHWMSKSLRVFIFHRT